MKPLPILATVDIQKGVYSNVAFIHHTEHEFILDFLFQFTGETQLVSRVILSTAHARALKKALEDNIKKYEAKYPKK
ncbi:MAG: DUF3467 domain-containing protein [Chloroflexi bacterium]|nr:DUF3467 domain-containing protein [Chloroflexota bacterium]